MNSTTKGVLTVVAAGVFLWGASRIGSMMTEPASDEVAAVGTGQVEVAVLDGSDTAGNVEEGQETGGDVAVNVVNDQGDAADVTPETQDVAALAPENTDQPETSDNSANVTVVEPETDAENDGDASDAEFDIVRVEADGEALIAGRTTANAEVELLVDGEPLTSAKADATGGFVMFGDLGASVVPRVMTLRETMPDGTKILADTSVIIAAIPPSIEDSEGKLDLRQPVLEDALPDTPSDGTLVDDRKAAPTPDVTETANAPAATEPENQALAGATPSVVDAETEPDTPAAPAVIIADEDGVRVIQNPGDQPEAMSNVSIDSITYDAAGEVALAGRAVGSSGVRVYLNNKTLIDVDIGPGGQWRADLPDVSSGTYTLRVDELDDKGKVISRAETPFLRESVASIQALDQRVTTEIAPVSLITVQPGNTLWGIADQKYGEGFMYVRVFEANTDRIRNPDLIYPGQIFSVPD